MEVAEKLSLFHEVEGKHHASFNSTFGSQVQRFGYISMYSCNNASTTGARKHSDCT